MDNTLDVMHSRISPDILIRARLSSTEIQSRVEEIHSLLEVAKVNELHLSVASYSAQKYEA